jgi:hypothetical protein
MRGPLATPFFNKLLDESIETGFAARSWRADAYRRKIPTTGIDSLVGSLLATQYVAGIDGDIDRECAVNNLECKND